MAASRGIFYRRNYELKNISNKILIELRKFTLKTLY